MNRKICLETARLIIRDHRMEDLPTHHAMLSDPEVMYYLPDIMPHSLEESRADLAKAVTAVGRPGRREYFLRLEEKGTGELVGEAGYTVLEETPVGKLVHAGYFSRRKFWGRGYMTEAFREILRFAFEENGVYRLTTGCDPENAGSERVMIKCGLIREADMKQKVWFDGRMHDRVEYRMLREEWNLLRRSGAAGSLEDHKRGSVEDFASQKRSSHSCLPFRAFDNPLHMC